MLAANGVHVLRDARGGTPRASRVPGDPGAQRSRLRAARRRILITPSHNPPSDGA
ncbi:MAG TPA: hypothetical protein VGS19_31445 [Streptosporangiaceae bacterium]|nr:hypothetical protein [Streptosporangiaceae bacterium]